MRYSILPNLDLLVMVRCQSCGGSGTEPILVYADEDDAIYEDGICGWCDGTGIWTGPDEAVSR